MAERSPIASGFSDPLASETNVVSNKSVLIIMLRFNTTG